ncbi:MAG: 5'-methylthioadenosine/adenosylhomocysteine nucleosidase [Oscillospiraceae bacterium]|nr:5'-methylthioadenosine/adenosylhomocysteine nucleosidase [Oscillospiraceae bacterium]
MKLGIIGAMDSEVSALQEALQEATREAFAGMHFCAGRLGALDAVVVKCGIGKVNAAMCVQLLKDHFQVTHIINTGVAGALSEKLDIGDIVISTEAVQHDFDLSPIGFQKAEIPPYGHVAFPADEAMRQLAVQAAEQTGMGLHVLCGRICSGDQFIAGSAQKQRITSEFGGLCAEMEGAAIAQVCCANALPFVIIRAISDRADDSGGVSFSEFEKDAARHSIAIVTGMAALLSE